MVAIENGTATMTDTSALVDQSTLFAALSEDSGLAVAVIGEDGRIHFANDAAGHLLDDGYSRGASLTGRSLRDFRPSAAADERLRFVKSALDNGSPVVYDTTTQGVRFRFVVRPVAGGQRIAIITGRPVSTPRREGDIVDLMDSTGSGQQPLEAKNNDLGVLENLTKREVEVLSFIGQGLSTQAIANKLGRSVKTIEGHRVSLGVKLGVTNRVELARIAIRAGLAPFDASADGEQLSVNSNGNG